MGYDLRVITVAGRTHSWRGRALAATAVFAVLAGCSSEEPVAVETVAGTAAPTNTSAPTTTLAPPEASIEPGTATATVGDQTYDFVVIQCVSTAAEDSFFEFQLDGVPAAAPQDAIERLLGEKGVDDEVVANLEAIVEFGPVLSITRLTDGGDQIVITDLSETDVVSAPNPLEGQFLDISTAVDPIAVTAIVPAVATGEIILEARCP